MPPEAKKPRTLIIGLDGATFTLLQPWVDAGHLPTFARLMAEGVHGKLNAWPNTNSAAAWSSIVTGYNPGQHGVYDFGNSAPQHGYRWRPTTALDRKKAPFWRALSAAGQHVSVLNVPISYPVDKINGFMLGGMDSPGVRSPGFSHPPGFYDELRRAAIDYVLDVPRLANHRDRDPYHMPAAVRKMVEGRARAVLHIMHNYPWDAIMAVFVATDRMQHFYWPHGQAADASPAWQPLRSLYQLLDGYLAEMLRAADDQTTVVILSDHGFQAARPAKRSLNLLFQKLGLAAARARNRRWKGRALQHLLRWGRRLIPPSWQLPLAQAMPGLRLQALDEENYGGLDWSRTLAYAEAHGGKVNINLRGRQPEGIVAPEDYEALRDRIAAILPNLVDLETGRALTMTVRRREEVYSGPYLEKAADLLFQWADDLGEAALGYRPPEGKPIAVPATPATGPGSNWRGTHHPEGIFIAWGAPVRRGAAIEAITQYDIAPTILHLQGQPTPSDMDGRVLTEIFTEAWLRAHPLRQSAPEAATAAPAEAALDEMEMGQVEARLRDLGYIE